MTGAQTCALPISKSSKSTSKSSSSPKVYTSDFVGPIRPQDVRVSGTSGRKQITSIKELVPTKSVKKYVIPNGSKTPTLSIDKKTGKPYGTITAYKRSKGGMLSEALGLAKASSKLSTRRESLRTKKILSKTGNIQAKKEAELLGLAAVSTIVDFGKGIVDLPETAYKLARNPKKILGLPKALKKSAEELGYIAKFSPGEAFVRVGSEILLMKGTGAALSKLSKVSSSTLVKLNPKYIGKAKIGKTLNIKTGPTTSVKLKVVGKIPKETLKSQVSRSGTRVSAISSQADNLLDVIRKSKVVRKLIPGEQSFNIATKKLLKQFDEGTISKTNLIKLDSAIKKQGAKGLLERSFFADPTGKIRPSRLGVTKDKAGSIIDYFSEDITFRKAKPQILLFENIKVQKLPKNLKSIGNKLKRNVALTKSEADKLLRYQLKKSGKFKSVGFVSGESEITLAPGEILKKVKKVGVTNVNGRNIPIVSATVYKPTGKVKTLLSKYKTGKITTKETKQLDKLLKKETGFNYGVSSSKSTTARYVDIKKIGAGSLSRINVSKTKKVSKVSKKPVSYTKKYKAPSGSKVKYTSRGQPYIITSSGKARFISSTSKASKRRKKPYKIKRGRIRSKVSKRPLSKRKRKKMLSSRKPTTSKLKKRYYKSYKPSSRLSSPKYVPKSYSPKKPSKKQTYYKPPTSRAGKGATGKRIKTYPSKKRKAKKKAALGYYVYEKRGKRGFVKLKGLPLTKTQAKDRLAYRLDNKISRTAKIVPVKKVKKFGSLTKQQRGYFNRYKKNLRNYKIVKGKRVRTPNTFIEKKGKGVISTPGEKRQLALNRKARSRRKAATRKRTKRPTRKVKKSVQRKRTRRPKKRSRSKNTKRGKR